jgi:hypothetical protein
MENMLDDYWALVTNLPFDRAVEVIRCRRMVDEETLEQQGPRDFVLALAERIASEQRCVSETGRQVAVALFAAGHKIDMYYLGSVIGYVSMMQAGMTTDTNDFEDSLQKVFEFNGKTEEEK